MTVPRLARILERPVRISGQLFFDASHQPGRPGQRNEPRLRATLWEIHPVYQIDVCRKSTLAGCRASEAGAWVPLDQFVNVAHEEHE